MILSCTGCNHLKKIPPTLGGGACQRVETNRFYIPKIPFIMQKEDQIWSFSNIDTQKDAKNIIKEFLRGYISYHGDTSGQANKTTDISYIKDNLAGKTI